jgi:signal transduction histidine kinase
MSDDRFCTINERTSELTGYSPEELQKDPSLWIDRIHPSDRVAYLSARQKLKSGDKSMSCDYRFLAKGQNKEKWLSERSLAVGIVNPAGLGIVSVYNDVSELVALRDSVDDKHRSQQALDIIDGLIHEIENNLQVIRGGLDLLSLTGVKLRELCLVESGFQRMNKLMEELDGLFSKQDGLFSKQKDEDSRSDPSSILKGLAECMKNDLRQHGIRLNLSCRDSLPAVRIDPAEFRRAVQTVMEFSRVLLPDGGELKIEAGVRKIEDQTHLELTVSNFGAVSIPVTEENVFRPFLKINGHSLDLSMTLAQQILERQDGRIFFAKEPERPAIFTILLRVDSE